VSAVTQTAVASERVIQLAGRWGHVSAQKTVYQGIMAPTRIVGQRQLEEWPSLVGHSAWHREASVGM